MQRVPERFSMRNNLKTAALWDDIETYLKMSFHSQHIGTIFKAQIGGNHFMTLTLNNSHMDNDNILSFCVKISNDLVSMLDL